MKVNIRELGGLGTVLKSLEVDSQEVRRYALRTLCNLSFDDNNLVIFHDLHELVFKLVDG